MTTHRCDCHWVGERHGFDQGFDDIVESHIIDAYDIVEKLDFNGFVKRLQRFDSASIRDSRLSRVVSEASAFAYAHHVSELL